MVNHRTKNAIIIFAGIALLIIVAVALTSCVKKDDGADDDRTFVYVYKNINYCTLYDKDTGVMYAYSPHGSITPLYNPDGSLRIYDEDYTPQPSVDNFYATAAVITGIDKTMDYVFCEDYNGTGWGFCGIEDWEMGDIVAILVDDNGTDNIYDDNIVSVRYAGAVSVG